MILKLFMLLPAFMSALLVLGSLPAMAELRQYGSSQEEIDELSRRCSAHSQNEDYNTKLLTGRLLQSRFKGVKVKTCLPSLDKPCERYEWYPEQFAGVLVATNRHSPSDKVFFTPKGFAREDIHKLDFKIGYVYAFCAEVQPRPSPRHPPQYIIYNYNTIYELK